MGIRTNLQGDRQFHQHQVAATHSNMDCVQTQNTAANNGSNASPIIEATNRTQVGTDLGHLEEIYECAPQVMVCSYVEEPLKHTTYRQPQNSTVTQNRQVYSSEGDGIPNKDPSCTRLMQTPSHMGAPSEENNKERESEKSFLGAGRASEKTAKMRSL